MRSKRLIVLLVILIAGWRLYSIDSIAAKSGKCGQNLTYTLTNNGTLTISGTGPMYNYKSAEEVPWHSNVYSFPGGCFVDILK